jgi:hypothetical protein
VKLAALTAAIYLISLAFINNARAATASTLHRREQRQVVHLHAWQGTVRFFRHHYRQWNSYTGRRELHRALVWIAVLRHELEQTRLALQPPLTVPQIICKVFSEDCAKALEVANCESRFSVHASNGQYFGLFQMGNHERALYGGSSADAWEQARAAHAYYRDEGWGPWECA